MGEQNGYLQWRAEWLLALVQASETKERKQKKQKKRNGC